MATQQSEWTVGFYADARGKSTEIEFVNKLPNDERAKVRNYLRLLREFGRDGDALRQTNIKTSSALGVATRINPNPLFSSHRSPVHYPARLSQKVAKNPAARDRHRRAMYGQVSGGGKMNANTNIRFEDWKAEQIQDPEFRDAAEKLEPAYQVARLRIMRGLTQKQLAELVGTKQSSIARLESGKSEPRLSFLRRIVEALRGQLEVRIVPQEEMPVTDLHR